MAKTLDASLVAPARRIKRRTAARPRRDTLSLVEDTLRLFMWTVIVLFTLLMAVVIAVG